MTTSYISPLRRITEAVSARLNYDFLCFKGALFDEANLSQSVADIACSLYAPDRFRIRKNFSHGKLVGPKAKRGRKPNLDYVVENVQDGEVELALEVKWAGSSHCNVENLLQDLIRLKIIKNDYQSAHCGLLVAGHKDNIDKFFDSKFFKYQKKQPFHRVSKKPFKFCFSKSRGLHPEVEKAICTWEERRPEIKVPDCMKTTLIDSRYSFCEYSRFRSYCWLIE